MKNYDVTLTAHYEKTISVCADSPEQAAEKVKIILFDTDLIEFSDEDFVCGEADITEHSEDGLDDTALLRARKNLSHTRPRRNRQRERTLWNDKEVLFIWKLR